MNRLASLLLLTFSVAACGHKEDAAHAPEHSPAVTIASDVPAATVSAVNSEKK
jgi:hypothetical protein